MSNSRLLKQGQVVSEQDTFTTAKTKLGRTKPSTGPRVGHSCLRGSTVCNRCRNIEHFFCSVKRVKRFVYVYLRCIVRNLKRTSKMSTLPPRKNFCGRPCPAPWCLGRLFIFARYTLRLRIQQKRHINFNVNKERSR